MNRKITLIRHGKTAGNLEKRYIGITDEPLCPEGKEEIGKRSYPKADIVFSSPLIRCQTTVNLIYPKQELIVIDSLRETDFGLFEGKNYMELSNHPEYQKWIDSGGEAPFPEGENRSGATKRTLEGFYEMLRRSEEYEHISAVVHGGTIMAILSRLFGGDYYSYHVENGEGYTFDLSHNGLYSGLCFRSFLG